MCVWSLSLLTGSEWWTDVRDMRVVQKVVLQRQAGGPAKRQEFTACGTTLQSLLIAGAAAAVL